jgi:putative hydrolase of the HAD superfamily
MRGSMIKNVIFDYGGTPVKTKRPWKEFKQEALAATYAYLVREGLKLSLDEFIEVDESVFRSLREQEERENRDIPDIEKYGRLVARLFPSRSKSWRDRVAKRATRAFAITLVKNHRPAKGVKRTLTSLKAMGMKLAVISNHSNHDALVGHLDDLGVSPHFVRVFSSSQLGLRKPDPRIFQECLRTLKADPSETIYVGNSFLHDVVGAKGAGLRSIWVNDDPAGLEEPRTQRPDGGEASQAEPDYTIKSLDEIPKIIREINRRQAS